MHSTLKQPERGVKSSGARTTHSHWFDQLPNNEQRWLHWEIQNTFKNISELTREFVERFKRPEKENMIRYFLERAILAKALRTPEHERAARLRNVKGIDPEQLPENTLPKTERTRLTSIYETVMQDALGEYARVELPSHATRRIAHQILEKAIAHWDGKTNLRLFVYGAMALALTRHAQQTLNDRTKIGRIKELFIQHTH